MQTHLYIDPHRTAPSRSPHARAAAEIEMILLIPLLLIILLFISAMNLLGPARVTNIYNANELALRDATVSPQPTLAAAPSIDPLPDMMDSIHPDLPALPNRLHEAAPEQTIAPTRYLTGMTLSAKVVYPSPPYTLSPYPVAGDTGIVSAWFSAYAEQSKDQVEAPLGLAPAFPP